VAGAWTARSMPIDVFPDLTAPTVTILTEGHGMAPEEMESLVTFPIESAINGASGVRRVRSATAVGVAVVWVEFDWGTDIFMARQLVAEKLALVNGVLPPSADRPVMAPVSSIMGEILFFALSSDNVDPLAWPAEPDGTVDQAVLKLGAFVMVPDLVDGGLAHVDVGESGAVGCAQPLLRSVRSGQHAGSPRSWGCSPACVAATRQELGRSVLAYRPAGWARVAAGSPESKWTLETQHDAGTVGWGPS